MKSVKLGVAGIGTVGRAVIQLLSQHREQIFQRLGFELEVIQIGVRRPLDIELADSVRVSQDIFDLIENPDIDIFVELMGGTDTAKQWVEAALASGRPVVTANKALIALHGNALLQQASKKEVPVAFEAAVAGGIPVLGALKGGLAANSIEWLAGIINGTGNFILSEMSNEQAYAEALSRAQVLGYAEADPTFDVEGIDAAHKLTILASMAFGIPLAFDEVYIEGISKLSVVDIEYAKVLGFVVKHLGFAKRTSQGIELRVHPTLIPSHTLLSKVDGVMNAVVVKGDCVGPTLYYGAGAGGLPTASAVVSDIMGIATDIVNQNKNSQHSLGFQSLDALKFATISQVESAYYLRIQVSDRAGIFADIAHVLSKSGVSIEATLQKPMHKQVSLVSIIIITQVVMEGILESALEAIQVLPEVGADIIKIRVDSLE